MLTRPAGQAAQRSTSGLFCFQPLPGRRGCSVYCWHSASGSCAASVKNAGKYLWRQLAPVAELLANRRVYVMTAPAWTYCSFCPDWLEVADLA